MTSLDGLEFRVGFFGCFFFTEYPI